MSFPSTLLKCVCTVTDQMMNSKYRIPKTVKYIKNISYGPNGKWNLLDVLCPRSFEGRLPVIINIHGGAWVYGTKDVYKFYCGYLANHGFAVVSFNYRLAPEYRMPDPLEDLNTVVKWVLDNVDQYHFDPENIFLVGDSAGGHMAAFYTCLCLNKVCSSNLNLNLPQHFKARALVLNCGAYYMPEVPKIKPHFAALVEDILGKDASQETLKQYSPSNYITPDFPPCYVMTATEDFLRSQTPFLTDELDKYGIPYVFRIYSRPKGKLHHIFHLDIGKRISKICNLDEIRFLKEHCV